MDVRGLRRLNAGQPEGVKRGGAVIEKEQVRSVPFRVPRIDSLILAIEDPETVKNHRHSRHPGSLAEGSEHRLPVVQRDACEWPNVGCARAAVDAVPAVDEEFAPGTRRGERPRFGTFRIAARSGVKGVHGRKA